MVKKIQKDFLKGYDSAKHEIVPKSNCPRCYGRGYVGRNTTSGGLQQCICLRLKELNNKESNGHPTTEGSNSEVSQTLPIEEATVNGDSQAVVENYDSVPGIMD